MLNCTSRRCEYQLLPLDMDPNLRCVATLKQLIALLADTRTVPPPPSPPPGARTHLNFGQALANASGVRAGAMGAVTVSARVRRVCSQRCSL